MPLSSLAAAPPTQRELSAAAERFAVDLAEPPTLVAAALRRLLSNKPYLTQHPVLSGALQDTIAAIRAERTLRGRGKARAALQ